MDKLFVSHELAVRLKWLGFNEPCLGFYTHSKELRRYINYDGEMNDFQTLKNSDIKILDYCAAPTYKQVVDWFMETHKLSISLKHYASGTFGFEIQKHNGDATGWTKLTSLIGKTEYTYYQNYNNAIEHAIELI